MDIIRMASGVFFSNGYSGSYSYATSIHRPFNRSNLIGYIIT